MREPLIFEGHIFQYQCILINVECLLNYNAILNNWIVIVFIFRKFSREITLHQNTKKRVELET